MKVQRWRGLPPLSEGDEDTDEDDGADADAEGYDERRAGRGSSEGTADVYDTFAGLSILS